MTENIFTLDDKIIASAMKNGILIKESNGTFIKINGLITLAYIAQLGRFVLCYGTSAADAGCVELSDFGTKWDLVKKDE